MIFIYFCGKRFRVKPGMTWGKRGSGRRRGRMRGSGEGWEEMGKDGRKWGRMRGSGEGWEEVGKDGRKWGG